MSEAADAGPGTSGVFPAYTDKHDLLNDLARAKDSPKLIWEVIHKIGATNLSGLSNATDTYADADPTAQ